MAQIVNILATDECQLNLDLVGDYDIMLNSVTGTMNIPIVVKNEDYVVYEVPVDLTLNLEDTYDEQGRREEHFRRIYTGTYRATVGKTIYITSSVFATINDFIRNLSGQNSVELKSVYGSDPEGFEPEWDELAHEYYYDSSREEVHIKLAVNPDLDRPVMITYKGYTITYEMIDAVNGVITSHGGAGTYFDEKSTIINSIVVGVKIDLGSDSEILIDWRDKQKIYVTVGDLLIFDNLSKMIETDSLTGHLSFKCNIKEASPRMRYILGCRYVLPKIISFDQAGINIEPGISERPPFLLGSPYYFIYVENAKCRSRFVWYPINLISTKDGFVSKPDYCIQAPILSAQENADEQNFIPASSKVLYNKILNHHSTYAATHQILNVIYNSFTPSTMFQFSGGQFTCSGENLSNVKLKIVGMFGEPMNNLSEVLWNFQLAPVQPPQRPPGVTKEGLAQIEAQKAEQEQQALLAQQQAEQQAALAQQQAEAAAQGDSEMQAITQMMMELKEENQKLLQMIIDQRQQINNAVAKDTKDDVKAVQKLIAPHLPTAYVGKGPNVNPFKPPDPIKVETISEDKMVKAIADAIAQQQQAQPAPQAAAQPQGVAPIPQIPVGGQAPAAPPAQPLQGPPAPNPYNVPAQIPPPPPPPGAP